MDLFLAICQGLGLALAIGIGGALVALFAAVMASFAAGIDVDSTDFGFFGETWFLTVLLALVAVGVFARNRESARIPLVILLGAVGAIAFAASLAEETETAWPGLIVGFLATAVAAAIAADVLEGAIRRARSTGSETAETAVNSLILGFSLAGMIIVVLSLFVPFLSLLFAVGLVVLALGRRRKAGEKYEGLRILR